MSRWRRRSKWPRYVSVGEKKVKAQKHIEQLRKKGQILKPVIIEGRTITHTFWGKKWCAHFESFSDYDNRLPRGRTYARHGGICHLEIDTGKIHAMVSGSSIYNVDIEIKPLHEDAWAAIKKQCAGTIGSLVELLQGRLSESVMKIISDPENGLFPQYSEIHYKCDCPDWALLCKHIAAVLYGIGHRFDDSPELFFKLRGVDPTELIDNSIDFAPDAADSDEDILDGSELSGIFGIELEGNDISPEPEIKETASTRKSKKKTPDKTNKRTAKKTSRKTASPKKVPKKSTRKSAAKKTRGKSTPSLAKKQVPRIRKKKASSRKPFKPTGKNILKLRKQREMTRWQFAQIVGVTEATIYRWENVKGKIGMRDYNLKRLQDIAEK